MPEPVAAELVQLHRAPVAGPGLTGEDLARIRALLEACSSPSTRRAYRGTVRAWCAWTATRGLEPWPASPIAVAAWIAELGELGRRPATIARHVAALATVSQARGEPSPSSSLEVRSALRGLRRSLGVAQARAAPLLLGDLIAGLPSGPSPRATRDRALLLLGWAGAMRRSELAGLQVGDLAELPEGFALTIRRSKADPEGAGATIGIPRARAPGRCPVLALRAWIALLPEPAGPLFRSIDRHGTIGASLSDRSVCAIVQRAARRAGLEGAYSGHSLRAGFATEAARAGCPERAIMRQTRHRSLSVVMGYIRNGSIFLDNPASLLL